MQPVSNEAAAPVAQVMIPPIIPEGIRQDQWSQCSDSWQHSEHTQMSSDNSHQVLRFFSPEGDQFEIERSARELTRPAHEWVQPQAVGEITERIVEAIIHQFREKLYLHVGSNLYEFMDQNRSPEDGRTVPQIDAAQVIGDLRVACPFCIDVMTSLEFHFDFNSIAFRCHADLISIACHFDFILISFQNHFHFDFVSISLISLGFRRLVILLFFISITFLSDFNSISFSFFV
jgi:hypothetical protein